jgi:hypothetical protein
MDYEHEFCKECADYGEPNGCNRKGGECEAYGVFTAIADERDALTADITAMQADNQTLRSANKALENDLVNANMNLEHIEAELTDIKGQIERGEMERVLSIHPTTTNRDGTERPTAIAVDFDGCICTNAWPEIGEANVPLIAFLVRHRAHGGELILWTCREGAELDKAVNWCWGEWGLKFDALNENLPSWKAMFGNDTRKLGADYYIDDKAVCIKAAALGKEG